MKKLLICAGLICSSLLGMAQSTNVPMLNTPKYLNIDSAAGTTPSMNAALMANAANYRSTAADSSTVAEKIYTFTNSTGQVLKITYAIKNARKAIVVNRITIRGSVDELKKIHKAFFNSDRTVDIDKNTYQLDYFQYGNKKFYVRFDPDTENNAGTSDWSLIIGKY